MVKRKTLRETAFLMVLMAGCSGQMSDPSTDQGGVDLQSLNEAMEAPQLPAVAQAEEAAPDLSAGEEMVADAISGSADGQEIVLSEPEIVQAEVQVPQAQIGAGDESAALEAAGVPSAVASASDEQGVAEADVDEQKPDASPADQSADIVATLVGTDTGLSVNELLFTRSISDRQPLEPSTEFFSEDDGRIYCYLSMKNVTEEEQRVTIHWLDEKGERIDGLSTELDVGVSQAWRTWAFSNAFDDPGVYGVEVEDAEGAVLATGEFELKAG